MSRLLLGLLSLSLGLTPLLLPPSPGRAEEGLVTLEARWLLLRKEDIDPNLQVQLPDETRDEGRALLTIRRFDPNYKNREDEPPVPRLTLNKLWLADDVATAQQIFQEQVNAGFPEAPGRVDSVGGIDLPQLGQEMGGLGGCGPCESATVHYRIVFRYLNAVQAVYIYGSDQYAYRGVAINLARILDERIRAQPAGPPPDLIREVFPRQVSLSSTELGAEINTLGEKEGSDDRAQWYEARFNRQKEFERAHIGPLEVYNKVWVARDLEAAHDIFAEQAQPGFPEAREKVGKGEFPMENLPGIGNENFGWTACNDNCNTEKFRFLHHRYVWRAGNVVVVLYTWGGDQDNNVNQVSYYAQSMRNRIP